jgi:hypothetical protein
VWIFLRFVAVALRTVVLTHQKSPDDALAYGITHPTDFNLFSTLAKLYFARGLIVGDVHPSLPHAAPVRFCLFW